MADNLQKIFIKKRRTLRIIFFLSADIALIIASVLSAFLVRFEGQIPSRYYLNVTGVIILALLITIPIFFFFKLYFFTWLYVSSAELINLTKAVGLSFLILTNSAIFLKLRIVIKSMKSNSQGLFLLRMKSSIFIGETRNLLEALF